jgi:hypothetical protein
MYLEIKRKEYSEFRKEANLSWFFLGGKRNFYFEMV